MGHYVLSEPGKMVMCVELNHSFIQVRYALEFNLPVTAIQGLAATAVDRDWPAKYILGCEDKSQPLPRVIKSTTSRRLFKCH